MQKIVILADGHIAKSFMYGLFNAHLHECVYEVVYYNDDSLPANMPPFVKKHKFDPTSEYKLAQVISADTTQVYIILQMKMDTEICINYICESSPATQIIALNLWDLQKKTNNVRFIDANQTLSAQLLRHIPSALPIAQNVGLGIGEIAQVHIVYGSKFAFRHIESIEQKNWRISAIYRQNHLILPKPNLVIKPNDSLLMIGQPSVLKDVYKAFKSELGQFPQPFGSVVYVLIESYKLSEKRLNEIVYDASLLALKLKTTNLVLRLVSPTVQTEEMLKKLDIQNLIIEVDYKNETLENIINIDTQKYNIGLIVICESFFKKSNHRKLLSDIKKPIFKLGYEDISAIKNAVVAIDNNPYWEAISGAFFDVAHQLGLKTKLLKVEQSCGDTIEHYQNLANLYSMKLNIDEIPSNMFLYLAAKQNMLHVLPLNFNTMTLSIKDIIFPQVPKFLRLLSSKNQLFIPI